MKPRKIALKKFFEIYSKVPRLTVDVVLKTPEGILLTKRDIPPAKGMWHIPGGTVLFGETHKDAVKRVSKEELGIEVKIGEQIGIIEYGRDYSVGQTTAVVYLVSLKSGKLKGGEQGREMKFFKYIPDNTIPDQAEFIKKRFNFKYTS